MAEDKPAVARAAAWMLLGIFALSAVAVAGREVSSDLDTFELMLYTLPPRCARGVGPGSLAGQRR